MVAVGSRYNGMLVPVRTSVNLRRRNEQNNELYQLKVDVGMLNTQSRTSYSVCLTKTKGSGKDRF